MTISFLRCHDFVWSILHAVILNIPPSRLALFPSLAGSVWFITLASLLITWLARGMRPYPGQSNPDVAFISDIASFELKPLFLVGASITAMGFLFTVAAVHVMRYEPGFALVKCPHQSSTITPDAECIPNHNGIQNSPHQDHQNENEDQEDEEEGEDHDTTRTLKIISLLSIFAAGLASFSLILLSVMDTFRYKPAHHIFLRLCFAGLALQSAGTAIVYADEVIGVVAYVSHVGRYHRLHLWGKRSLKVRIFATLSTTLILIEVFLGVAFISLTMDDENSNYRAAGILEWVIAFLGTIYLWLFCGFFDRSDFNGYVPSLLYQVEDEVLPAQGHVQVRVQPPTPILSEEGNYDSNRDPERDPLLGNGREMDRKYT